MPLINLRIRSTNILIEEARRSWTCSTRRLWKQWRSYGRPVPRANGRFFSKPAFFLCCGRSMFFNFFHFPTAMLSSRGLGFGSRSPNLPICHLAGRMGDWHPNSTVADGSAINSLADLVAWLIRTDSSILACTRSPLSHLVLQRMCAQNRFCFHVVQVGDTWLKMKQAPVTSTGPTT